MELLAVIVVLAVILAIAIPSISKTINNVKKGAFESSIHGYAKAAENKYLKDMITGNNGEMIFIYENGILIEGEELNYDGERIPNGAIHLRKDGKVALVIYNDKWCAIKNYNSKKIEITPIDPEEECEIPIPPYIDPSGANAPVLATGMTPIKWDEDNNEISTTKNDHGWYDYGSKKWANVKTKDGSYWVWIPRYAYKITSGFRSSTTGTIDIKFLQGTTNNNNDEVQVETSGYEIGVKDTSMHYFLHPAFDFDGNIPGIWVAKFEANDGGAGTVKVIPNATSWQNISIKSAYNVSLGMKDNTGIYGWSESEVDTHMMKNTEWGAVAYLSKSIYGADTEEIWNNAYNQLRTGCSGRNVDDDSYGTCVEYNEEPNGIKASTTHNIYGIYDMSGGSHDQVMGNNDIVSLSGFSVGELASIDSKYINRYNSTSETFSYGDAIYEIRNNDISRSWYGDYSYLINGNDWTWFLRGTGSAGTPQSGVFTSNATKGNGVAGQSFRPVIVMLIEP